MREKLKWVGIIAVVVVFVLFGTVAQISVCTGIKESNQMRYRQQFEQEAISHNAATYRCDPTTGEVKLVWKDEEEGK